MSHFVILTAHVSSKYTSAMYDITSIPKTCTLEQATVHIGALVQSLGIPGDVPDVRTLRLWRTKKLLTIEGHRFTPRNILEVIVILKLRAEGLTLQHAVKRTLALDEDRLRFLLSNGGIAAPSSIESESLVTLQLLARGILALYRSVEKGAIVGHTDRMKQGIEGTPLSLLQAMARLGRSYFIEGMEDRVASIHQLLQLCQRPLKDWAPHTVGMLERYREAILIDPTYRVPNEDCETIAEEMEGTNLSDLIEHHLHEQLRMTLSKLGHDADVSYTYIREFIGRHPLVTTVELQHLYLHPELNDEAIDFVRGLYQPIHATYAVDGHVRRCYHCGALIGEENACILAGCRDDHSTEAASPIPLDSAYLARPEVLKYWVDPAREELRIYDTLRQEARLQDRVSLYPHSDWCDISIDEAVGVDVKDYHDPVRLAQRLNHSIGHLSQYPERILAIAKRRWSPIYRDRLVEQLTPEKRALLHVMSVDQAIKYLKRTYGGGSHASEA